ncbi:hypothetical protein F4679DRAFT_205872 [Xylaria curta]|nr:hypothetical protein F4679DRAFT_205872 [Xylaria curta]
MSFLETLPVELVGYIATPLERRDVLSLRLTCRALESKIPHAQLFARKHVELDQEALKNMVYMTSQGRVGTLLQHCTIYRLAEARDNTMTFDDERVHLLTETRNNTPNFDEHVRLLTEAFINLKKYSPRTRLASVSLRVFKNDNTAGPGGPPVEYIAAVAPQVFHIAIEALRASELSVDEHLDLFGGNWRCSLPSVVFLSINQRFASVPVFRTLKKLTLKLSSSTFRNRGSSQSVLGTLLLQGLLDMTGIMPDLEDLDIHWYNTSTGGPDVLSVNLSGQSHFSHLKTCSLRGLYVPDSNLLEFLKAVRPVELTMTDISLAPGTWTSIFEYVTSSDSPVTYYHLDDLHESRRLVHFDVPGESKFPYLGVTMGPSTLTRQANEVKEAIQYGITLKRPLGSGWKIHWYASKMAQFGPLN